MAIEFAALAIPFGLLVFAVLEACISFAGQQLLSNAADNLARQLRTGQVKAAQATEDNVKKIICDQINILVATGCPELVVDLRQFSTFQQAASQRITLTAGDLDTTGFDVKPGPSMSKNMLRVFYRWPVITDLLRKSMSTLNGGKTLLFATATWQNEPFDD